MKIKIFELPYPTSEALSEPEMHVGKGNMLLLIGATQDQPGFAIKFSRQRALRKKSEAYCTAWDVDGTFDTLCEVPDSMWVNELKNDANSASEGEWVMRHFMIYIDGFGCVEAVCESASIE